MDDQPTFDHPPGAACVQDVLQGVLIQEDEVGQLSDLEGAKVSIDGERLRLDKPGKPKLVERVDEVTFNGRVGLAQGKKVFYVTDLAVLELTDAGLTLRAVMPGIDIQRDLLANSFARIVVPDDPVPQTVAASIVTGDGFHTKRES